MYKAMYKGVNNLREQKGFTLIELLIVIAIIGILAAIGIPAFLGMQERGRKAAVIGSASAAESEILAWLSSSRKTGPGSLLREIDTTGDGVIDASDRTNAALATYGVARAYVEARVAEMSPWLSPATSLWRTTGTIDVDRNACATGGQGLITLGHVVGGATISIEACDNGNAVLHYAILSAD